jgi:hypothetical protein
MVYDAMTAKMVANYRKRLVSYARTQGRYVWCVVCGVNQTNIPDGKCVECHRKETK